MAVTEFGKGWSLEIDDGGTGATSGSYTAFNDVKEFTPPHYEIGPVDITSLSSTQITFIPGWKTPSTFTVKQLYTSTEYARVLDLMGDPHSWKVKDSTGTQRLSFAGYVAMPELPVPQGNNAIEFTTTGQCTGVIA